MAKDREHYAHLQWLGYVQPVGLVVSIPAMLDAQAQVNANTGLLQQRFLACLRRDAHDEVIPEIAHFPTFVEKVLGWKPGDLIGTDELPNSLEVVLQVYNETLRPTYAVRSLRPDDPAKPWLLLIQTLPTGTDLDKAPEEDDRRWQAGPQARLERLLRETKVPIGLLVNGTHVRLVYAPHGETSGYMTFSVANMAEVAGRPILAAFEMLLGAERVFNIGLGKRQDLASILADSRKRQNVVSTELAEQVLAALNELLRGFQAADDYRRGQLLADYLQHDQNQVYGGLLTVLMRLVFVLYAEDRDLLSADPVFVNHYSVAGLFERLRSDDGRYPDTMDQRYGAWAQLLSLFRLIYDGGSHGSLKIPGRQGYLFDPDRYPFLEGRPRGSRRTTGEKLDVPRVSDGVVYRVLANLLMLDGERLSYRTLDVEQIGSVYETVMGFNLEVAAGRSIAVKATKSGGAPTIVNLEALAAIKPADRVRWLTEQTGQKFSGQVADTIKQAGTIETLRDAIGKKVAWNVTPGLVPKGAMILQPSDERRRSGSHYTPRSLTEPIVRTTLRPVIERLGSQPTPEQILDLKVCDPAMGSGAFLVEACRQLGDELVLAWHAHKRVPIPPRDESELLHARRLIAQHCLYGVDKNPMAVDLARLSLWLATLAKDHPFTFLDHALRCGDSLVGLTREQIAAFHWQPPAKRVKDTVWFGDPIATTMKTVAEYRQRILAAQDEKPYDELRQELEGADKALAFARLTGDCVIAAYFSADKDKARLVRLDVLAKQLVKYISSQESIEDRQPLTEAVASLHGGDHPLQPFHWQIEFPEVFTVDAKGKPNGGFDAIVGNPPFAGKNTIISGNREGYLDWLLSAHPEAHGNADLVAHFFRHAFNLLRPQGCFGLIATNTIGQGDTRSTGLRWICTNGGTIYNARRRCRWPGQAAVVVSVVHVSKSPRHPPFQLDGRSVDKITAYLFHSGGHEDPASLIANTRKSFNGTCILGMGFTFDDTANQNVATSLAEMQRLIRSNPKNAQRIRPYLGGEELNTSPTHQHNRYVIDFGDLSEEESRGWPELMAIIEAKVKPVRLTDNREAYRRNWWQFGEKRQELYSTIESFDRVIVISRISNAFAFTFVAANQVLNEKIVVFADESFECFCVLQSRVHEIWARLFSSTLKDDLQYTHSRCFENFPFPIHIERCNGVQQAGSSYFSSRSNVMVRNNEGLTKTYNRFHDPDESSADILQLRDLHATMDRAVLEAYGWHDLAQTAVCEFLLDYEDDEDEEGPTTSRARTRRKPWRYRWPDEFRDEVLARLLALNSDRAAQERLSGQIVHGTAKPAKRSSRKAAKAEEMPLFDDRAGPERHA